MLLWLIIALLLAAVRTSPTGSNPHLQPRQSSPCGELAKVRAEVLDEVSAGRPATIPSNTTYACLTSVPVQKEFSIRLLNGIKAWFELQSDIDYVASPPSGSLWPAMDMFAYFNKIATDINDDQYSTQYDLEVDLYSLALHFHDYHTLIRPGLFTAALFDRGFELVSYSKDGLATPEIYVAQEVLYVDASGILPLNSDSDPNVSPVSAINGLPVQEFLQTQALIASSHDPDAMYNQLFLTLPASYHPSGDAWSNTFRYSPFYIGSETTLKFENGSEFSYPTQALIGCDLTSVTSGDDFWQICVFEPEEAAGDAAVAALRKNATTAPTATTNEYTYAQHTARAVPTETQTSSQLSGHPEPLFMDIDGLLSGYYLQGYDDVAVLVVRSFNSESALYQDSFQNTLSAFLEDAQAQHKTKLILDVQGNGGGFIDLSTELMAQLFPNVPPDQKANFRASLGMQLLLEKESAELDHYIQNAETELDNMMAEGSYSTAWQAVMDPDGGEFSSFEDFYGPNELGKGGHYTNFFQANYSNTNPSEVILGDIDGIQITGYGDRQLPSDTPPPFEASNIVLLSDGLCGSACTIVFEMLTNVHSVPSIVIGGRPDTGPMQTVGNTKGSLSFDADQLQVFLWFWEDTAISQIDPATIDGTIFEYIELFGLAHGVANLNGKNNYRIGDTTETPLQMVYTAADCRIWHDIHTLVDQEILWGRVADIAFDSSRKELGAGGGPFTSEYCIKDSTGHPTSVTGGLKQGELGDQTPPDRAYPKYTGWLKDGREIVQGFSLFRTDDASPATSDSRNSSAETPRLSDDQVKVGLANLKTTCSGYSGNKWMIALLCAIFK